MGCYHLGKFVSKALGKCNGRERGWREERLDYAMAYPPGPPTETYYVRPVARTVTFSAANSVYVIPPAPEPAPHHHQQSPDPQPQPTPPPPPPQQQQQQHEPDHHQPQQDQSPPPPPPQDAPPAEPPKPPKRSGNRSKKSGRVRFGPEQTPPPQEQQQEQQQQPSQQEQQQAAPGRQAVAAPPGYFRYTPSPLPRWEAATPRRHEYFSGEYRYSYPTPVREGIYRMATDANRLTTIFSEENPNACAIM